MRNRIAAAVVVLAALAAAGCSTVSRVGAVLEATGEVVGKVGEVLSEGATGDMKKGTDAVGITAAEVSK